MISLIFFLTRANWLRELFSTSGPVLCQRALPPSEFYSLYDALICGTPLPAGHAKQMFVDTGLIHLMVVSGAHLVFVELLLVAFPKAVRLALLGGYCYLTGFQAPVMRAFLRRALAVPLYAWQALTPLQVEAAAVAMALFLYPQWMMSRSFLMSWMCGLALCTPRMIKRFPHLDTALKNYVLLLPFCWSSPLSVAWNTLLAPFVGVVLFPVCLIAMIVPPAVVVSDFVWAIFLKILAWGPQAPQFPIFVASAHLAWIPPVTHFLFLVGEVRWRRASAFLPLSSS